MQSTPADNTRKRVLQYIEKERKRKESKTETSLNVLLSKSINNKCKIHRQERHGQTISLRLECVLKNVEEQSSNQTYLFAVFSKVFNDVRLEIEG